MSLLIFFLNPAIGWPGRLGLGSGLTARLSLGMAASALVGAGVAVVGRVAPDDLGDEV